MADQAENWIEWKGGDCPVAHGTQVQVRHRDGDELVGSAGAGVAEDWSIVSDPNHPDFEHPGDIVAYRVVAA